jgi:hypothetical protein
MGQKQHDNTQILDILGGGHSFSRGRLKAGIGGRTCSQKVPVVN